MADRTRDEVIEATLKAACIRASATVHGIAPQNVNDNIIAHDVVNLAKLIYIEATRGKWQRGDDGEGATAGTTGPIVLTGPGAAAIGSSVAAQVQIT